MDRPADDRDDTGPECDLSDVCPACIGERGERVTMAWVKSHYECPACRYRDSCCF